MYIIIRDATVIAYPIAPGYVVIDLDRKNGKDGVKSLKERHNTLITKTKSGGLHVWYALPKGAQLGNRTGILPGVDLRTVGGFVRDIPSPGYAVWRDLPIAEIPPGLLALIQEAAPKPKESSVHGAGERQPWVASSDSERELLEIAPFLRLENRDDWQFAMDALAHNRDQLEAAGINVLDLAVRMSRAAQGFENEPVETIKEALERPEHNRFSGACVRALITRARDAGWTPKPAASAPMPDPEPLPTGLPPVDSFDENLLPLGLRAYVTDIAERLQCPLDFPAVAFMVCLSSVVGGRVAIHPKRHDDWTVLPNLWGAIVGRPSLMKTPALGEATKMLYRMEALARSLHAEKMIAYEAEMEAIKVRAAANKKKAAKLLDKSDQDKSVLVEMLRKEQPPAPPTLRRYIANDATVEKLGELLQENPEGLLLFRDELVGWLRNMDRDGHEGDRAFYLEAWTGGKPFTYDRIARGSVFIDRVTLAVLGGIQPGPLRSYVSQATQGGAGDDGLLQRFQLLVWPDAIGEWRNVDRWPDTEAKQVVWGIFERLADLTAPTVDGEPPALRFDEEGQEVFDGWRAELEARLRAEDLSAVLESHLAKYRSLVPSIALLSHLVEGGSVIGRVKAEHVRRAIGWARYLESHARRVYSVALDPDMAAAVALSERLKNLPDPLTARDVYRRGWAGLDRKATDGALRVLVDFGHLLPVEQDANGRPTTLYRINPKLKNFSESLEDELTELTKPPLCRTFVGFVSRSSKETEKFSVARTPRMLAAIERLRSVGNLGG
ncbi:MAG: DUF3987 domain-containing protein [Acidithiobacillus caldus]|uniref:DUF3987 domain-containing protein n=1 Tax=Acidithiobacillus caldus TaxID=33059 RepID=UPI002815407A|nr:DUF3987 domain-containing protein [Acidithiobacillus caldus]WMT48361.1 MAG: DUF3987 domain-containing protein [Acidithiobacillus caldus]